MTISPRLKTYLQNEKISYELITHPSELYHALDKANRWHLSGKEVLKSVIVNVDGQPIMCVLPAVRRLDLEKFKKAVNADNVSLVNEGSSRTYPTAN